MSFNPDVHDYSQYIEGPIFIPPSEVEEESTIHDDSAVSTIEQSTSVTIPFTPAINFPILTAPQSGSEDTFNVVSLALNTNQNGVEAFLLSQDLRMQEIMDDILDAWLENLREIEEQVQAMLRDPQYQQLQEIRLKGNPSQGVVSGVETPTAANAAEALPSPTQIQALSLLSFVDRNREMLISSVDNVSNSNPSSHSTQDPAQMLTIPFTLATFVGGALSLGSFEITTSVEGMSSNPMNGTMEIVERMQPIMPQIMQDILPTINLLVMPLIYFTSWDSSIGVQRNKERENHLATAQNFAREVIKMVSDPAFIMTSIVNKMEGAEKFTPEHKERLAAMIKLILASVALSLLYAVEVGKAGDGKFWGMDAQEFRDLIKNPAEFLKTSDQGELTTTQKLELDLATIIGQQLGLEVLSPAEKEKILAALFEYFSTTQKISSMTDPAKVFTQVLHSSNFNQEAAMLESDPA